jgi:hypothetical protein
VVRGHRLLELDSLLILEAPQGCRDRFEAIVTDRAPAASTRPIGARVEAPERGLDAADLRRHLGEEAQLCFACRGLGGDVREVLVRPRELAERSTLRPVGELILLEAGPHLPEAISLGLEELSCFIGSHVDLRVVSSVAVIEAAQPPVG